MKTLKKHRKFEKYFEHHNFLETKKENEISQKKNSTLKFELLKTIEITFF